MDGDGGGVGRWDNTDCPLEGVWDGGDRVDVVSKLGGMCGEESVGG